MTRIILVVRDLPTAALVRGLEIFGNKWGIFKAKEREIQRAMKPLEKTENIINEHFKLIFLVVIICSLSIRMYIFLNHSPSEIGRVEVAASHLDIALGIINGEEFSFNFSRHLWIEKNLNRLLDSPVSNVPDFSNSDRVPIAYMDPGYGMIIGYIYKFIGSPVDFRLVQMVQIVLDIILLFILYFIGREIGLSKLLALIPVIIHGFNLLLLRSVFQIVQDFFIVFLVILSVWILITKPKNKYLRLLQYTSSFVLGGLIPWVRSLFVLFPVLAFILIAILVKTKHLMRHFLLIGILFILGSLLIYGIPRNLQFSNNHLAFSFGRPGCFWYPFYMGLHQFDEGPTGDELALKKVYEVAPELRGKDLIVSWTKIDSLMKEVVIQEIEESPVSYVMTSLRRCAVGLFPSFYSNYTNQLKVPGIIIILGRIVLFVLSLYVLVCTVYMIMRKKELKPMLLLLPWAYVVFVSCPFFLQGRSLMPAIDLIVVFSLIGVQNGLKSLRRGS